MRIYNRLLITLLVALSLVNVLLAAWRQNDPAVYFIADIVVTLAVFLYFSGLNMKAQRALNTLGGVFFGGFVVVFIFKLVEILK